MLDIEHPQTRYIFQASSYIDQLKISYRSSQIEYGEEQQLRFKEMRLICCRFNELSVHFQTKQNEILLISQELLIFVNQLAERCFLEKDETDSKRFYDLLYQLERQTGAWFI